MRTSRVGKAGRTERSFPSGTLGQGGYAYVLLLAAVAILAVLASTASVLTSYRVKREKEEELLFRGEAYRKAIKSYYLASPGGVKTFPRNLEDLLADPRFPGRKRHLRSLYSEPFGEEWSFLTAPGGGIMGVASPSREAPLKRVDFPRESAHFAAAASYADWIFRYDPKASPVATAPAPALTPGP